MVSGGHGVELLDARMTDCANSDAILWTPPRCRYRRLRANLVASVVEAGSSPVDPPVCRLDEVVSDCFERLAPSEIMVQGSILVAAR